MPAYPKPLSPRFLIGLLGLLTLLDVLAIDLYLPAFNAIGHSLGGSPAAVQATLSVFIFGLAAGQLAYGPLMDRYGRRRPLLIGIGLFVLGSLLSAWAPSIEVLIAARLLQAMGAAAGVVAPRAIVSDVFKGNDSARAYARLGQLMMLGPAVAPTLGALLLEAGSWRYCFLVLGGVGLIVWVLLVTRLAETQPSSSRASAGAALGSYLKLLRNARYMYYNLSGAMMVAGLFAYINAAPFVLTAHYGLSALGFGLIFGFNALMIMLGGSIGIRLLRYWSPGRIMVVGMLLHTLATVALLAASHAGCGLWLYVALLAMTIGPMGMVFGNLADLTMAQASEVAGTAAALAGASQYGVGALVGVIMGLFSVGAPLLATTMVLCALVMLSCAMLARNAPLPINVAALGDR